MPLLRYNVAVTLDGFIASPDDSTDWIIEDPSIDFDALYAQFDTFVMGRKTYQVMMRFAEASGINPLRGKHVVVISSTMAQEEHPDIEVLATGHLEMVAKKRACPDGKDIWLMGGGRLAHECLNAGILDTIEAAVMPVVIGNGVKMISPGFSSAAGCKLAVESTTALDSGIILTKYRVSHTAPSSVASGPR